MSYVGFNNALVANGGGGGVPASFGLYQFLPPEPTKTSATSMSVKINTFGMQDKNTVTQYRVTYIRMKTKKTPWPGATDQTVTSSNNPVSLTGLVQNAYYKITTQVISSSAYGNMVTTFFQLNSSYSIPVKIGTPKTIGAVQDQKSFLKITGGSSVDDLYSWAYRDFDGLPIPTFTIDNIGSGANTIDARNYTQTFYAFGTTFLMPSLLTGYEAQGGGIGFFVDPDSGSGYFITIDTSGTAANRNSKPVKIFKLKNKRIIILESSQQGNVTTLDRVIGGKTYEVEIKVRVENKTVEIVAYINGFKITASDTTSSANGNIILNPTKTVSLVGSSGTTMFDYIYATKISRESFLSSESSNFYKGQFSKDFLTNSFGDLSYTFSTEDTGNTSIESRKKDFDEFGTVVREIAKKEVKFSGRPSVPVRFTTGSNKVASIVSQRYDNFSGEVFVLNNSSLTVPLSDRNTNQLSIYGYDIGFSGDIEYTSGTVSDNINAEPVVFESKWLHYEDDVKSLADWIRSDVINKAKIVQMEVFGNPLLSVGDIITVNYEYQGFTPAQKIIIIKITQGYIVNGGISTKIIGRTI